MLTIYHVPGTRSVRPLWLCYELGLDPAVERIDFSRTYRDAPEWRAISPAGKVPAMRDGYLTMFESGAMVDYLAERYDTAFLMHPRPGTTESAIYHQWCWFAESTLIRFLGLRRVLREPGDQAASGLVAAAVDRFREAMAALERALESGAYLVGDSFSAADIMLAYSLTLVRDELSDFPNATAYLGRATERPAYQRIE